MTGRSGAVVDDEEEYEEVEEEEEESDMRSADCSSGDWGERGDETTSNQFSNHRYHLPPPPLPPCMCLCECVLCDKQSRHLN